MKLSNQTSGLGLLRQRPRLYRNVNTTYIAVRATGGRHPEQAAVPTTSAAERAPQERPDVEGMDSRYRRCVCFRLWSLAWWYQ